MLALVLQGCDTFVMTGSSIEGPFEGGQGKVVLLVN